MLKATLPPIVYQIAMLGGLITGSQAKRIYEGRDPAPDSDWDIMVPYERWHLVASLVPMVAVPTGFGGWRFNVNGVKLDVWPDDLRRCAKQSATYKGEEVYVIDLRGKMKFTCANLARGL